MLILTDVTHVFADYGKRHARPLPTATGALHLPEGSMRPKTEAAAAFVERTGSIAAVGPLDNAPGTLVGTTATLVQAESVAHGAQPTAPATS
jgi:carbamate kinase